MGFACMYCTIRNKIWLMCVVHNHQIHTIKLFLKSQLNFDFCFLSKSICIWLVSLYYLFFFLEFFFLSLICKHFFKANHLKWIDIRTTQVRPQEWFILVECLFLEIDVWMEKQIVCDRYHSREMELVVSSPPNRFIMQNCVCNVHGAFNIVNANMRMMCAY